MAWSTPLTAVSSNQLAAADWNASVRDNLLWLGTRKGFKIRKVAAQSIPTGAVTAISFDTEDSDTDGFGSVPSSAYTIPTGLDGLYAITGLITLAAVGTQPLVRITAGGATYDAPVPLFNGNGVVSVTVPLVATHTIALSAFQNSGGAANCTATLLAHWVGR